MIDGAPEQFRAAIIAGLGVDPGPLKLDGRMHRFATKPGGGDEAGWAVGYADGIPAGSFGCWRSSVSETWCARDLKTLTPAEREVNRRRMTEIIRQRDADEKRRQAIAAKEAAREWTEAGPASESHPYLSRKGVAAYGVRQSRHGLMIPIRIDGELSSYQTIDDAGVKKFRPGGATAGGYHSIGRPDGVVIVCEGYATGASLHAMTGHAVAVAFTAGNLEAVARTIRAKMPDARIIIAGDDDWKTTGNPGKAKALATATVVGGIAALPTFVRDPDNADDKRTDWNDLVADIGEDAAGAQFAEAVEAYRIAPEDTAPPSSTPIDNAPVADAAGADRRALVDRLAALDAIAYDQEREAAAKSLGIRAPTLDKAVKEARETGAVAAMSGMFPVVEPWPDAVDGATILDEVRHTIGRFIICEPETKVAAALWIAFTWLIEVSDVAPLALVTAPEKRCGKTQLLDLIRRLSMRPLVASNISSAAVYRVIEAHRPTLLIDEADAFMKENEELRGVINSGHTRTSAFVIRTVGDDHEPRQFSTWGAKAISGIGSLPETIMDRAIILELRRKLPTETVQRLRHAEPGLFQMLARRLARFASDNEYRMRGARPVLPEALNDRAQDNWEPLLSIADMAGGHWPDTARKAALKISGSEQEALSTGAELLADIKAAFDDDNSVRLPMALLIGRLCADDLGPWATWNRGKPISPRQLGKRLQDYDIAARTLRFGTGTAKGFERSQFEDCWSRYLSSPGYPPSVGNAVTSEQNQEVTCYQSPVTLPEKNPSVTDKPLKSLGCYHVTDGNPHSGDEAWEATI